MCKIPELLDKAKEYGMSSLAITDHGVMYGVIEFYKEAKKRGMKPIIGFEGYIAPRKMTDKTPRVDGGPGHIVLLAKNYEGYMNLIKLTSEAHLKGYYYKPRIDKDLLRENSGGIIALSSCVKGEIGRNLLNNNYENAKRVALEFRDIFGEGNFYLELQHTSDLWEDQLKVNEGIKKLSKETGIGLVCTNDVHYIESSDKDAQDALLCLQTGTFVDTEGRMKMEGDQSLISPEKMAEFFSDCPEALENTVKIAEQCNLEIELGNFKIPEYKVPKGETTKSYLNRLVNSGLEVRYGDITDQVKERTKYELEIIENMGFEGYFLIVWDFVKWAKDHGIVVGPGRGSAAGSIVSYALNITEIDPLKYDLFFERFLNPDRISMPDIDMDFADDRRDEVINYVTEKYGRDHVAQIITFGTMKARNAIRDTGRVLGFPYSEVDRIAKMIPDILNIKLKDAIDMTKELKSEYNNGSNIKKLLDIAMKLEGVSRHASTHAAGVIISPGPLTEYVPLQFSPKGDSGINTQFTMGPLEDLGLLKIDFLGLSNLTVIKNTLRIVKKVYEKDIDIEKIPLDDKKTYDLLSRGATTGIFQLESGGMKRTIKDLKPTEFEDIIALVALYRPGPMQFIPDFIKRKHGKQKIFYLHSLMEEALSNTYGIMVYQEQVIRLAKDMAGFSGGEADTLRKAMGKKIAALMKKMRVKFIEGSVKNGIKEKVAEKVFDDLENFSQYAFNKSHAACYALIAYQTAYLKAYYPAAFMAALMTSDYSNIDRIAIEIDECRRSGIEVLPPDVNESYAEFAVVKETGKIRFGMKAIKNVGMGIIEAVVRSRDEGGKFKSIMDFLRRVDAKDINKKVMEALIKCGAMDSLGEREDLLLNIEKILAYANKIQKDGLNGQTDLFGSAGVELQDLQLQKSLKRFSSKEKLDFEKELLGVYITDHPLREYQEIIDTQKIVKLSELQEYPDGKEIKVAGVIITVQNIYTRNKDKMLFARLEDVLGSVELVVFPKILEQYSTRLKEGNILIVTGKFNMKDGDPKILVEKVTEIDDLKGYKPEVEYVDLIKEREDEIVITIPYDSKPDNLKKLKELLVKNKGSIHVAVNLPKDGKRDTIRLPFGINFSVELKGEIERIFNKTVD